MKNIATAFLTSLFLTTSAFAASFQGTVTAVLPEYKHVKGTEIVTTCNQVDVPIYQQQQGNSTLEDFLKGAIVGGVIGNNIPGENGGGAIGAIIGGAINSERSANNRNTQTIVGYKQIQQCTNKQVPYSQQVYQWSWIKVNVMGRVFQIKRKDPNIQIGDVITVNISVN